MRYSAKPYSKTEESFFSFTGKKGKEEKICVAQYSYDIHGNVNTLVQDNALLPSWLGAHRYKRTDYKYDLISGKVTFLKYQPGKEDAFYHRYRYDADNRLQEALTSEDGNYYELDARYFYYLHGPLARVEIGRHQVQGLDYAYTINGWVKGVNSETLHETRDIGRDGDNNLPNLNKYFARDVFGYALRYFDDDFLAVGRLQFANSNYFLANNLSVTPLYNGNISATTTTMKGLEKIGFKYRYDQLNRLIASTAINGLDTVNNSWNSCQNISDYYMKLAYDPNGNILSNIRNGATTNGNPLSMDGLTYNYYPGTNRLNYLEDSVAANNYADDLDNQQANNYNYDAIGNLTKDESEEIAAIEWDVYGKIKRIKRSAASAKPELEFRYDGMGNRVSKKVIPKTGVPETTYYVRDAQGNIMATYKLTADTLELEEQMIYGSQRLGALNRNKKFIKQSGITLHPPLHISEIYNYLSSVEGMEGGGKTIKEIPSSAPGSATAVVVGRKRYEMGNWLGNVHVVVSDRKIAVDVNGDGVRDWWRADVRSSMDYYPGGMQMPGRSYNTAASRFGFNRMLVDNEIYGVGNSYTAEFWQYDPRLGRRWNREPVVKPWESSYAAFNNNPIFFKDPLGLQGSGPGDTPIDPRTGKPFESSFKFGEIKIFGDRPKSRFGDILSAIGRFLTGLDRRLYRGGDPQTPLGSVKTEFSGVTPIDPSAPQTNVHITGTGTTESDPSAIIPGAILAGAGFTPPGSKAEKIKQVAEGVASLAEEFSKSAIGQSTNKDTEAQSGITARRVHGISFPTGEEYGQAGLEPMEAEWRTGATSGVQFRDKRTGERNLDQKEAEKRVIQRLKLNIPGLFIGK